MGIKALLCLEPKMRGCALWVQASVAPPDEERSVKSSIISSLANVGLRQGAIPRPTVKDGLLSSLPALCCIRERVRTAPCTKGRSTDSGPALQLTDTVCLDNEESELGLLPPQVASTTPCSRLGRKACIAGREVLCM